MKFLVPSFFMAVLFAACQNSTSPQPASTTAPDASAILSHKYWIAKSFNDALFAPNISDTLSNLPCGELVFTAKDSVLMTACLSDAGLGSYKIIAPNTLSIAFEGDTVNKYTARLDEKTGVLHLVLPASMPADNNSYPVDFIPQDGIEVSDIDNITYNLGRKRLAGTYTALPQKGVAAPAQVVLNADGTQSGLGDYDQYQPYISGIGSGAVQNPQLNMMYLVKKGKEAEGPVVAWQLHGDTLSLWDTKTTNAEGDMPEYKIGKMKGKYVRGK